MRKPLVLRAKISEDMKEATVTVVSRCDIESDFGGNKAEEEHHLFYGDACCFIGEYGDYSSNTSFSPLDGLLDVHLGKTNYEFKIKPEHWPLIKRDVLKYNEWIRSLE